MVRITKFRSKNPLTKEFWLENGERKSKSSKALAKGTGQIIECEFEKLGELMEDCDSHEVLCYGLNNLNTDDKFKVTTEEYEDPSKKIYARTKENFKFKKEPTVFFVDHDTNDGCPKMTPASLHKAFVDTAAIGLSYLRTFHVKGRRKKILHALP